VVYVCSVGKRPELHPNPVAASGYSLAKPRGEKHNTPTHLEMEGWHIGMPRLADQNVRIQKRDTNKVVREFYE